MKKRVPNLGCVRKKYNVALKENSNNVFKMEYMCGKLLRATNVDSKNLFNKLLVFIPKLANICTIFFGKLNLVQLKMVVWFKAIFATTLAATKARHVLKMVKHDSKSII